MGERALALGMYASAAHAERAVDAFIAAGISTFEVSFLLQERMSAHDLSISWSPVTSMVGTLSTLAGIDSLTLPPLPAVVAAGPLMAHLRTRESKRCMMDLASVLTDLGTARHEAKRLERAVKDGGTLVTVHCKGAEEIEIAQQMMHATGASEVATACAGALQSHSRVA